MARTRKRKVGRPKGQKNSAAHNKKISDSLKAHHRRRRKAGGSGKTSASRRTSKGRKRTIYKHGPNEYKIRAGKSWATWRRTDLKKFGKRGTDYVIKAK